MKIHPNKKFPVEYRLIKTILDFDENVDTDPRWIDVLREQIKKFKESGGIDPLISEAMPDKVTVSTIKSNKLFRILLKTLPEGKEESVKVSLIGVFGSLLKVQKESGHIMVVPFSLVHPEDKMFVYNMSREGQPFKVNWESDGE